MGMVMIIVIRIGEARRHSAGWLVPPTIRIRTYHAHIALLSLCFALLCFALLCFALLCFAVLCFAMLCFALPCWKVPRYE